MFNELSILIPVYNYDAVPLVEELHKQARGLMIRFEIKLYDDASTNHNIRQTNGLRLGDLPHVVYKELPENLGRAKIRNLLAQDAEFSSLLFIDADSELPDNSFLKTYKSYPTSPPVIAGGTIYSLQKPRPEYMLRWVYGHKREARPASQRNKTPYRSFQINNLLIDKQTFLDNRLNEAIQTYGHEDTELGLQLEEKGVRVLHIDNPVRHTGLETAEVFLEKTEQAVKNLLKLYRDRQSANESAMVRLFERLKQLNLTKFVIQSFGMVKGQVFRNLKSSNPNMRVFDFYKLYLICRSDQELRIKE